MDKNQMIGLKIIVDIKKGTKGKCDAENANVEEVAMMIAMLEEYQQKILKRFSKMSEFNYDSENFKSEKEE